MKKFLLPFVLSFLTLTTALAADLNPFAYDLKSTYNEGSMTLTVYFSLNAPASYMKLAISDGTTDVWTKEYLASSYQSGKVPKATYTEVIDVSKLPKRTDLTWRVDVKGFGRADVEKVDKEYYFYHPSSIDVDNNTESENFGTIFCVESLNTIKSKSAATTGDSGHPFSEYLTYTNGAGLYVFNAAFENQLTKNGDKGYNGGINFDNLTYSRNGAAAFCPRRVRVSSDGRIFLSSQILDGTSSAVLWEVPGIGDKAAGWHRVIQGSLTDYSSTTEKDGFYAAPNISLDTRGQGADLELALISGTSSAWSSVSSAYRLSTYKLGENADNPTLNKSQIDWFDNLAGTTIVAWDAVQIEGDNDGGFWICQGRGVAPEGRQQDPSLIHFNKNKQPDLVERRLYRYGAGIRFNNDFSKLIVSGKSDVTTISGVETKSATTNCTGGYATIYDVTKDGTGAPILTKSKIIDMRHIADNLYINDFAWDYADNIYAVSHRNEMVAVWAMPYDAGRVKSTPAASKYTFSVDCQPGVYHTVTMVSDPNDGGSITCMQGGSARTPGVLTVESCTELTLTAIPAAGHKFVNWTDDEDNVVSTTPEYSFYVTDEIKLIANFEYATYNVTWHNLLNNKNDLNASGDLDNLEELWYLITTYFNDYNVKNNNASGDKIRSRTQLSNGVSATQTFFAEGYVDTYVEGFLTNSTGKNYLTFTWLGDYINTVKSLTTSASGYYYWLTHFFAGYKEWYLYNTPSQWLPYYWRSVCGLPSQMVCIDKMPVEIKEISPKKSEITNPTVLSRTAYPSWYVRNHQEGKLLAWRDGSTTGNIVHHVSRPDMQLYATYVDKALQEDDPTPDLSKNPYDATNNDVLSLLNNKNYGATTHNVTMDRKFAGGMYNTICLPFDLPITLLPTQLQGADIRLFDGVTETYTESGDPVAVLNFITLDEYWDNWNAEHPDKQVAPANRYMEAGIPYLIKPVEDVDDAYLTYSGLPYWRFFDGTRTPYGKYANGVTFQGVLNPTTLPENAYILVADERLAKVTDTSEKIKGYRGYFVINDIMLRTLADQGNVYFSFKKPVTTSIPVAPEAEQQAQPKVRKVMYDGQIYILRGDEIYTITGNRVQ